MRKLVRHAVVSMTLIALAVGCAEQAPEETGDDGAAAAPGETEEPDPDPADGDPGPAEPVDELPGACEPLGELDREVHDLIVAAIAEDVAYGPLVAVAAEGALVIATTTYEEPGVPGGSAAWIADGDSIVAIDAVAAEITPFPLEEVDTAGTDAVAGALAEAQDCSWLAADAAAEDRPEPEPELRPDLLVLDPAQAGSGSRIAMTFPEETSRGVAFHLDRETRSGWETTHWMTSDANQGEPETVPAGTDGFGWPDVGIAGPGPDHVDLPDDLEPGNHRICTANAGDDFCAPLEVTG